MAPRRDDTEARDLLRARARAAARLGTVNNVTLLSLAVPVRGEAPTMSHRSSLLAVLASSFLVGCGSTVVVEEDGGNGGPGSGGAGLGGAGPVTVAVGPGPVAAVTATSVVSSTATTTVTTIASTGSGLPFGPPDLFEQELGAPSADRNLFTLSDTALGAYVAARSPSTFSLVKIDRLVAPSGDTVLDGLLPSNEAEFSNYQVASLVIPSITHPEMFPPALGSWSVKITGDSDATDLTVLERRTEDGEFHGGELDVNVFVVPGVGDPDYLREMIEEGFGDYAGLKLGALRFYDAPESFYEVNENNYFEAQQLSAGAPVGQAVTLLAVGYIGGQLEGAAGFSPGAPADPLGHGSASSTLVWWVQNDGFFDHIIVSHETGHYAGLFHTSEYYQQGLVDPLSDTPECPELDDQNFFDCPDYGNIMFFSGGDGTAHLSPQQEAVIQGSAIYRGSYAAGENPAGPFEGLSGQAITSPPARSITLDGRGSSPRWPGGPTPSALREGLAPQIAILDGIGCATGGSVETSIAEAARSLSASELIDAATDRRLSPLLRMRALLAASRAAGSAQQGEALEALALDASEPEAVRAGAVRALGRSAPSRREAIAPVLRADASRLVRHLAR